MPFSRVLMASLLVHIILMILLMQMPAPPRVVPISLVFQNEKINPSRPGRDNRSVVQFAQAPKEQMSEEPDDRPAQHLSLKRQRVKKESKTANSGLTTNASDGDSKEAKGQPESGESMKAGRLSAKAIDHKQPSSILVPNLGRAAVTSLHPIGSGRKAATGEHLPQVMVGGFNALNTDYFTYYGFYSRINSNVRPHWESRIDEVIRNFQRVGHQALQKLPWVTHIEILLDSDGKYKEGVIHHSSGIEEFDEATRLAIKLGAPVPNPPKALVQEDGLVHLHYQFIVGN